VVREYVLYITAYASVCAGVRHSVSNLCVSLVVRGYVVSVHSCVLFVSFGCNYSLFVCLAWCQTVIDNILNLFLVTLMRESFISRMCMMILYVYINVCLGSTSFAE